MDQNLEQPEVQGIRYKRLIQVLPYDPQWAQNFIELRDVLAQCLGPLAIAIEHVGSTSVPGLAAKPILDIDVIILDKPDCLEEVIRTLKPLGYSHLGDLGITGRAAFARQDGFVPWNGSHRVWPQHYLYILQKSAPVLLSYLAFRDYLREHPDDVREYGKVKLKAAKHNPHDIEAYMEEKRECIERINQKAEPLKEKIKKELERLN